MSRRSVSVLLPVLVLALLALAAPANADDYFIKIAGIPGDVTNEQVVNSIQVDSFAWNVTAPAPRRDAKGGGGGAAGRPTFSDFLFTHRVDSASPLLFRAAATGQRIRSALFTVMRSSQDNSDQPLEYCLEDVAVTGVNVTGKAEEGMPREAVSLNYARFEERFNPGNSTPPVFFGWDLVRNASIGFNDSCGTT